MDDHEQHATRDASRRREGWTELFPFALFGVTVVAAIVAIALT
jgi:hypothetical protein